MQIKFENIKSYIINHYVQILSVIVVSIIVYRYFQTVLAFSLNIPTSDDYDVILSFLNAYVDIPFPQTLDIIFDTYMEHRIAFGKLITISYYEIFHEVNFIHLILIGNLSMIGTLLILYHLIPIQKDKLFIFLPVSFLFLHMQHYENAIWAMASLQNLFVVFFSLLSLILLNKKGKLFLFLGIFFAVIASFTSGSGLFTFIAGVILLLFSKRSSVDLIIWILSTTTMFYVYFFWLKYTSPGQNPDPFTSIIRSPEKIVGCFFALVGSNFSFDLHYNDNSQSWGFVLAVFGGFTLTIAFFFLLFKKYFFTNPLLFSCIILYLIICLSASVSRFNFGAEYMADAGRYKINSIILCVLFLLAFINLFAEKMNRIYILLICVFAGSFWAYSYTRNFAVLNSIKATLINSSWTRYHENSFSKLVHYDPQKHAAPILLDSEKKGTYKMPDLSVMYIPTPCPIIGYHKDLPSPGSNIVYAFDIIPLENARRAFIREGWAFINNQQSTGNKIYVLLKDEFGKIIFFKAWRSIRPDVTGYFASINKDKEEINYDESGFSFSAELDKLPSGHFEVGLLIENKQGETFLTYTNKYLNNIKFDINRIETPAMNNHEIVFNFDIFNIEKDNAIIAGWAFLKSKFPIGTTTIVLYTTETAFEVSTISSQRIDVANHFNDSTLTSSGFTSKINWSRIPDAEYKVGIMIKNQLDTGFVETGKIISRPKVK
jgi:hypothetical protein